MKRLKKLISIASALVMTVSTVLGGTVFAAESSFSDVTDDNRYKDSIITLTKLGVIDGYDDGTFKPEGEITRAEFTKMLITALGYGGNTALPTQFDDTTGHWAATFIRTAYDMGIINGTGERTFEPDKPVTYEQALKMLVCTLGYEGFAISQGGYPAGYISQAGSLRLTDNITGQGNSDPAARQVIAQAVYNSLEVPIMTQSVGGQATTTNMTILKDHLGVVRVQGILTGVEDTVSNDCDVALYAKQIAVRPTSGQNRDTVVINLGDYTERSVGELSRMLGNEMTFYYAQGVSDDDKQLRILDDETTKNTVTTVGYKNFMGYSGGSFKYADGASVKTLKISDDATVIYNGKAVADSDLPYDVVSRSDKTVKQTANDIEDLLRLWLGDDVEYSIRGDVAFTDSGADGTIDMLTINDYKTILAYKAPTTSDYRLQDALTTGTSITLDPNDLSKKIYIEKDGKEIQATAIRANDIVSYTESIDGSVLNLYVISETVSGTVNSINTTDMTITIGTEVYDLGEDCARYIQEKEGKTLTSGVTGTFYLDKLNAVVYGKLQEVAVDPYGYITAVNEDLGEGVLYVTAYIPSVSTSSAASYRLSGRVRVNGKSVDNYGEVMTLLEDVAGTANQDENENVYGGDAPENTAYSQPVRIKISGDEITDIKTIDTAASGQNEDTSKLVRYRDLANYYYSGSSFKNDYSSSVEFSVNSSTTVIYVPKDRSQRSEYSKKTISNAFTSGQRYWVEAYDVNQSNVASLVILYGDNAQLNSVKNTTDYSVVADISAQYDMENDETTQALDVYAGATTSTRTWTAANESVVNDADVQIGDVIQFDYDDENKIQNIYTRIKYADVEDVLNDTNGVTVSYSDGERTEVYNWAEATEPTQDNWWQAYTFDFRFPKSRTSNDGDLMYTSSALGEVPYSRVCVYNVYQLVEESNGNINKMYLTKEGFDAETGELRSSDVIQYDEVTISSGTRILRMEELPSGLSYSPYAPDTTENLTARDLKDAAHYGQECSKVIVCSRYGGAVLIIMLPETAA